jgi:hypothetical protein
VVSKSSAGQGDASKWFVIIRETLVGDLQSIGAGKKGSLMTKGFSYLRKTFGKTISTLVLAAAIAIAVPSGAFAQRGGGGHAGGGGHVGGGFSGGRSAPAYRGGGGFAGGYRGGYYGGGFRGGYGGYRGGYYGGYRGWGWGGFGLGFGYPYYGYGYGYGYPSYAYPYGYSYPAPAPAPNCGYYDNYGYWHSYPGCYSGGVY